MAIRVRYREDLARRPGDDDPALDMDLREQNHADPHDPNRETDQRKG